MRSDAPGLGGGEGEGVEAGRGGKILLLILLSRSYNASQTRLSNNTFFFFCLLTLKYAFKGKKMEVSILYNIKYLQGHGSLLLGVCSIKS